MTDKGNPGFFKTEPKKDLDKEIELFEIDPSMIEVDLDELAITPGMPDAKPIKESEAQEKDGLLENGKEAEPEKKKGLKDTLIQGI
jgi:hypothetical protein